MTCPYCHTLPHLPGCPNEPDPKPVAYCDCCCEGIYPGDEIYRFGDEIYHANCVKYELTVDDILDLLDITPVTAEEC